jgi:hypothetical protein
VTPLYQGTDRQWLRKSEIVSASCAPTCCNLPKQAEARAVSRTCQHASGL